ncbi:MAG: hypothetical protein ACR2J9_11855 [Gaiellales bacterium]
MRHFLVYEAILVVVVALAVALGIALHALGRRRAMDGDGAFVGDGISSAAGYVGGAVAFLLGLLLLFSVQHYDTAKSTAHDEAIAYSATFDASSTLDPAVRTPVQRDLVCLMRSIRDDSWNAVVGGEITGNANTLAWLAKTRETLAGAPEGSRGSELSRDTDWSEFQTAENLHQQRLLLADNELPPVVWGVIYISIFILFVMLAVLLRDNRLLLLVGVIGCFVITAAIIAALLAFADPFSEFGATIQPDALTHVMERLQVAYPGDAWKPCESLVTAST